VVSGGKDEVHAIIQSHIVEPLPDNVIQTLRSIIEKDARQLGLTQLPSLS